MTLPGVPSVHDQPGPVGVAMTVCDLWIPLSPALIQPTPVNGASLNLVVTGTAPTSGFLSIFGIHTTTTFGDMGYSGSPAVFPTT